VKNNEDGTKILEQIVPFFGPAFTIKTILMENMASVDVPIILNGVKLSDANDEKFEDRRIQIWNLDFTLKGYFYGPVANTPIINMTTINLYEGDFPAPGNNFIYNYGLDDLQSNNLIQ